MGIENYSKTPASNDDTPPNGWPEGMLPSQVNNSARQNMADTRTWYEDSQWVNYGYTPTYASATSFTIATTDYTSLFHVGRRIKAYGLTTTTIYGTITASSYAVNTTITVEWDAGSLQNETLTIYLAALSHENDSIPYINKKASDVASAATIDLNAVNGDLIDVTGTAAITTVTLDEGQERTVRFTGALTLTNGANLILPSAANITTVAGDFAIFRGYSGDVVRCINYQRIDGKALINPDIVPVGTIIMHGASTAPIGLLDCDGAAVSRTTYADLFAVIGTTWGIGDGATTFNLPDLRGEFVRGWDDGRGIDTGRAFASSQGFATESHTHNVTSVNTRAGAAQVDPGGNFYASSGDTGEFGAQSMTTNSQTGTTSSETRPRNIAVLYCIKY